MSIDQLSHPLVRAVLIAMSADDREAWFALFTPDAILTDDGNPHDFREWSDGEVFGENRGYVTSVERETDNGLTLRAKFHSDRWGDFTTYMIFHVADDKITQLDVGQA
jgi:hypothetical protein